MVKSLQENGTLPGDGTAAGDGTAMDWPTIVTGPGFGLTGPA